MNRKRPWEAHQKASGKTRKRPKRQDRMLAGEDGFRSGTALSDLNDYSLVWLKAPGRPAVAKPLVKPIENGAGAEGGRAEDIQIRGVFEVDSALRAARSATFWRAVFPGAFRRVSQGRELGDHRQRKRPPKRSSGSPSHSWQVENPTSANHSQESRERLNVVSASGFLLPN